MRFAIVNGDRVEPQPKLTGICAKCSCEMISKCGKYVIWHWAHKSKLACDSWQERETEWHLEWKNCFPKDYQEIIQTDNQTGERHIADVKVSGGLVVEVQHSPISEQELHSREEFYRNMIWIVDARDYRGWISAGGAMGPVKIWNNPLRFSFTWRSKSKLFDKWSLAKQPVYFDFQYEVISIPTTLTSVSKNKALLHKLLDFDSKERIVTLAPISAVDLVNAIMKGEQLPLWQCSEERAVECIRQHWQLTEVEGIG